MAMKLSTWTEQLKNYQEKRKEFFAILEEEPENKEKQNQAYGEMMDAMAEDIKSMAESEAAKKAEETLNELNRQSGGTISANEVKFFNAITTDVGYKEESLLPQETIDRIFEDLKQSHPLLMEINIINAGLRLKFLKSDTSGTAVWGKVYSEIKGQLDAVFSEEEDIQDKLTAFVVIPNDLTEYGPKWTEAYVRTQIVESFSIALVKAAVDGDGDDKPIGLRRDVSKGVSVTDGVYPVKAVSGTLTFKDAQTTINEMTGVMGKLSTKENGKQVSIDGKVILLCNPSQVWELKAKYTIQNANGVFVTAIPFGIRIVEAEGVPKNEVIAFVKGRYDAYMGGNTKIKKFDQTLAIEDCTLYTAKAFYYGKARDDKAALRYTLDLTGTGA